jgi:hypothetical protein
MKTNQEMMDAKMEAKNEKAEIHQGELKLAKKK